VRLRAVAILLAGTAGDYLLWDWSIASSHDILSLVSGLTLLPLAALSVGVVALAGARGLSRVVGLGRAAGRVPVRVRGSSRARATRAREDYPSDNPSPHAGPLSPTPSHSSPDRLAA
jgi:hypothetical protein